MSTLKEEIWQLFFNIQSLVNLSHLKNLLLRCLAFFPLQNGEKLLQKNILFQGI
jgi:hypothetical protein